MDTIMTKLSLRNKRFELIGFVVSFLLVCYVKFFCHELWKDEWQAWFVARDKSIWDVFSFLNYEGHPALWYLYLKPFTWISSFLPINEEYWLHFAHLLPVVAVLFLFWKVFKLPSILKFGFSLSYFLFFEYGIVNRGYILVILLLFLAVFYIERDYVKRLAWTIFLLCQTEVFGVFMALSLGLYLFHTDINKYKPALKSLVIGVLVFILSVYPRESGHIAKTQGKILTFSERVLTSIQGNLTNALLPGTTQDTSLFGWSSLGLILSIGLLGGLIWIFRKQKSLMLSMLFLLLMSITFSLFFFVGGVRQWGMVFIFLLALLGIVNPEFFKQRYTMIFLLLIAGVQTIYGLTAIYRDINLPFTNAKETGLFIQEKIPEKVPVVAINKFEITPVIGYAKRKFFELPSGEPFSYFKWVEKIYLPTQEELKLFAKFKGVGGLVIITPKKLEPGRFRQANLWKEFTNKNIKNENYFLYTLSIK
ncbi:MAG: hypothetical protein WAT79_16835 [Saprospiraceae bacterium]